LPPMPDLNWQLVAAGDLNGDGVPELIWHNGATGANRAWFLSGTSLAAAVDFQGANPAWTLVAVGDLNGDNQADLIWRKTSGADAGVNAIWFMSGTMVMSGASLNAFDANWQLAGAVDVNGDGYADLVWQHATSGAIALWYMTGSSVVGSDSLTGLAPSIWQLVR